MSVAVDFGWEVDGEGAESDGSDEDVEEEEEEEDVEDSEYGVDVADGKEASSPASKEPYEVEKAKGRTSKIWPNIAI